MHLGPYENLREMLDREFGKGFYTDDNAVVNGATDEGVAFLWVTHPDRIVIEPSYGPNRETFVLGALP